MNDSDLLTHISELIEEEHRLRNAASPGDDTHERVRHLEEQLDQCWDLLRQRRAKREFGDDPGEAHARDVKTVEGYIG